MGDGGSDDTPVGVGVEVAKVDDKDEIADDSEACLATRYAAFATLSMTAILLAMLGPQMM